MPTSAVGATSGSQVAVQSKSLQALTTEDFLKMLMTELTQQDPFEPVKNQDLMNQLGSIRELEMNQKLNSTLESLLLQGQLGSAGGLLGKIVSGLTPDDQAAQGVVTGVRVTNGQVMLDLDTGQQVGLADVTQIHPAPTADAVTG